MRDSCSMLIRWSPVLAAWVLVAPNFALAQGFSADYALGRPAIAAAAHPLAPHLLSFGQFRLAPALNRDGKFAGGGLSLAVGQSWFAEFAVGRNLPSSLGPAAAMHHAVRVAGGYHWDDGESLTLQVTGARGGARLGLSLSYDWPRYFVRLGYDSVLRPLQQDRLRFSAGLRF